MHAVQFDRDFAQQVLDAISSGNPIPVPPGDWTGNHMLTTAGVLFAAIFSQGPHRQQALGLTADHLREMHPERREAVEDTLQKNIHAAIEFSSLLAFKVLDGEYDEQFEPEVRAVVYETEDGKQVIPVEGFKAA